MKRFHLAVNEVCEGRTVLCRIKELSVDAPSLKLDKSVFGDQPPVKGESFVADLEIAGQSGNYLLAASCKLAVDAEGKPLRSVKELKTFDVSAYMRGLIATEQP